MSMMFSSFYENSSPCGFDGKECAICGCGGGCVASMRDDYYYPATKEQIIQRLDEGKYPDYRQLMIDTLKNRFGYEYEPKNDADVSTYKTRIAELEAENAELKERLANISGYMCLTACGLVCGKSENETINKLVDRIGELERKNSKNQQIITSIRNMMLKAEE